MKRSTTTRLVIASAAATAAMISTRTLAADFFWDGDSGPTPYYSEGGNWVDNIAPGTGDVAVFDATLGAPPRGPEFFHPDTGAGVTLSGLRIINSEAYTYQLGRDLDGEKPGSRNLYLGADGITLSGGGHTSISPETLIITASQTWDIASGTTLSMRPLSGSGRVTIAGGGLINLAAVNNSTFTGGFDITGGTVIATFGTNSYAAAGATPLTVSGTGEFSTRFQGGSNFSGPGIVLANGGTLSGNSPDGLSTGQGLLAAVSVSTDTNTTVTLKTVESDQLFRINSSLTGGHADGSAVIRVTDGTVELVNGSTGASAFLGKWRIENGATLRIDSTTALGNRGGASNHNPVELDGGNLALGLSPNAGAITVSGHNVNVLSNGGSILIDRSPTGNSGAVTRGLTGNITIGSSTLTIAAGEKAAGAATFNHVGTITLTGHATFNLPTVGGNTVQANVGAITGDFGVTKTGPGTLRFTGTNTYTGGTTITEGFLSLTSPTGSGFSTSRVVLQNGASLFLNGVPSNFVWNVKADISGVGSVTQGGITNPTLNLQGSRITPGGDGAAGQLTVNGHTLTLSTDPDNSDPSELVIDVIDGSATAGVSHDRFVSNSTLSGLANTVLVINVSNLLTDADLLGDTLTIVTATSNFTGLNFAEEQWIGDWGGTVNYTNGNITLSDIHAVPEPGTLSVVSLAGLGLLARRRRRQPA